MCGRYKLQNPDWVEMDFSQTFPTLADAVRRPRYNVAPGQLVLAVRAGEAGPALEAMKWGIAARWKGGPPQLINARDDKLAGSRLWKPMLTDGRCAIPADGFYEWKAPVESGGKKQPWLFTRSAGEGFWFAGLSSAASSGEAGGDPAAANECAIITVSPNELVEDVHDRMPAMLGVEQLADWLGEDAKAALAALRPFESTQMAATPIGRAIGSPANEGPELIEPVAPDSPQQGSLL